MADQLKVVGFVNAQVDPSLYILRQNNVIVSTILVHVDDILLAGTDEAIQMVEKLLNDKFKLTMNDEVYHFLSFNINRNRKSKTFTINQASYIHDQVELYHLEDVRSVSTPCEDHFKDLCRNKDQNQITSHPYCLLIGALLWISNGTRPDITYAVNWLSAFMTSPTDVHWKAAQRVLVYLRDTSHYSINLGGLDLTLSGHSDSNWAEQREDRRSTTGFIFCLGKSPVSLKSRFQPTIALSSTGAEYMSLTVSASEAIWWRSILTELDSIDLSLSTVIHYDNKGARELAMNPCHHSQSKHIDMKHNFIRECVSNSTIFLFQVLTLSMLADVLTKPLERIKHQENIKTLFQA